MTNAPRNVLLLEGTSPLRLAGRRPSAPVTASAGRSPSSTGGCVRVVIGSRSAEGYGIRSLLSVDDNNGNGETEED
jgi:hypothetical protein